MRRGGLAALAAVAVLGMSAAGCGSGRQQAESKNSDRPAATAKAGPAYSGVADLPARLEADGTTITVGDPDAKVTVHLYEDPRCPVCEEFETAGGGPKLREATLRREAKTQYTLASFLDDRLGGKGSKKAVNALRAALEAGRFAAFHEMLYAHQPEESVDGFTDAYLLKLAGRIHGLRSPAFDSAVRTMKYRSFVTASQKEYERAGGTKDPQGPGTPTAEINGARIPAENNGVLFDPDVFVLLLSKFGAEPGE